MAPSVSVIIPCYNHARYVAHAVASARSQTVPPHEIIIVNDGSTDGSAAVLDDLAVQFPALVRVFHQQNSGPAWTRQQAVEKATGEWVLPLDADDFLHPEAIAHLTAYAARNPRLVVVYSDYYRVDENNTVIGEYRVRERRDDPLEGKILNTLVRQNSVTATALIRRDKILEVGGYYSEDTSHSGRGHEDYFVYLKLALRDYEFGYLPEALFYYRVTGGSVSSRTGPFYLNRLAVLKHVYKLDVDRMVEAEDYATFRRVDQLEDAFMTLRARDREIAALKERIATLEAVLNAHNVALPTPPQAAAQNTALPAASAEFEDVRAQLDELRRLKASRVYWFVYRVLDPAIMRLRHLFGRRPAHT